MNIVMPDDLTVRVYGPEVGNAIEVRGHHPYGVHHRPGDPMHRFLDSLDPATVSMLMAGDDVYINPRNSRRASTIAAVIALTEGKTP